ncbi:YcgL domain-containing protein [Cobetia sp. 1CM21F]|uniref:YcgL domain-containing protein n=1 Tax=Cobetia sp. 1CM21F TaxID=2929163 RepID=UPI0032B75CA4
MPVTRELADAHKRCKMMGSPMTDDKMICEIYKSARKDEMYLYVEKARGLKDVPESLLGIFGTPTPLMTLLIRADKPLARVASTTVLEKIREQGFYLQMPPAKENLLKEIGVTPPETHY